MHNRPLHCPVHTCPGSTLCMSSCTGNHTRTGLHTYTCTRASCVLAPVPRPVFRRAARRGARGGGGDGAEGQLAPHFPVRGRPAQVGRVAYTRVQVRWPVGYTRPHSAGPIRLYGSANTSSRMLGRSCFALVVLSPTNTQRGLTHVPVSAHSPPHPHAPDDCGSAGRYLDLFETPRVNNMALCKYYLQTSGKGGSGSRGASGSGAAGGGGGGGAGPGDKPGSAGRPVSREVGGSVGRVRPGSGKDWRPGG